MVIKIGFIAITIEARLAVTVFRPEKKNTLYANTPVSPRSMTGNIWCFFSRGILPSIFIVMKTRKMDAMANLRKEALKGPTFCATTRAAIKVPPQKMAVSRSLT